ncbi:hypothetical protein CRENBAI_006051 [Crenichthys baileyi]|uniref:Leucine-rich repeat-containing protein 56 n=1 Tax=Crenichthys baileyi TaxID=28760 RepID=A0AAV9SD35_9TELE
MSVWRDSVVQEVRPGTGRVQVTELSGSGCINPTPAPKPHKDPDEAVEPYLSPERLELLCGTHDLSCVNYLEVCVDTQENTLGDFGAYLPKLEQLKMNNSLITSLRDLGTTLSHLQVLWMSRCCLQDLNGISTLCSLKVEEYNYRAAVRELVPQLRYLDDMKVEEDRLTCCSITGEDWDILRISIQESNSSETAEKMAGHLHPYTLTTGPSGARPISSAGTRSILATRHRVLSPPGSRPASSDSNLAAVEAETSALTHGAGQILFCGNPVQAVRARREKLKTAPTRSSLTPHDLPIHVPEHTYDLEEPDPGERVNVFAELRAWREQYSKRLDIIEKERLPQILAIHSGEEETNSEEEEEGLAGMKHYSSDEEQEEDQVCDSLDTGSPDSSFQSLSPDLNQQEACSPNSARLSLSPDTTVSPSPPFHATAAPANMKLPGIHAHRLCLTQSHSEQFSRKGLAPRTTAAETDLISERLQHLARPAYLPHPPSKSSPHEETVISSADMDMYSLPLKSKMSKVPKRPIITRPHTAKAALQKYHQHHLLPPYRGSSNLD